jgi:AraC family transcriptional regulator of adaptative response/methylated-DNA-[protein]-cysteine methyltransferase
MDNHETLSDVIDYLVARAETQESLDTIASRFGFEATYFQKLFKSYVGLSPKQFQRYISYRRARDLLIDGMPTLDAAYEAGLSGQGRLHDLFLTVESVTPGEIKNRGVNLHITYGFAPTSLGELMIAKTNRGLCWLGFRVDESSDLSITRMKNFWPLAHFQQGNVINEAQKIETIWQGHSINHKLKLDIYGTNMQLQVWQALLRIPFGMAVDYKSIAGYIGKPKAARAVGNAVGANPLSLLIPCHRVIQASGIVNNYGWGSPRKKVILGLEGSLRHENQ